ncbi:hypothetical protein ACLE20_04370 [Rhizobium sp. YIM 134829]|uniref:hypothetical protein n=1 Tax=Rhizobium sp. YIM 134829 TaxID=3390453 RepID=UPI0039780189
MKLFMIEGSSELSAKMNSISVRSETTRLSIVFLKVSWRFREGTQMVRIGGWRIRDLRFHQAIAIGFREAGLQAVSGERGNSRKAVRRRSKLI